MSTKYILDSNVRNFVELSQSSYTKISTAANIAQQRQFYLSICREFSPERPLNVCVEDGVITGQAGKIPLRVYVPATITFKTQYIIQERYSNIELSRRG